MSFRSTFIPCGRLLRHHRLLLLQISADPSMTGTQTCYMIHQESTLYIASTTHPLTCRHNWNKSLTVQYLLQLRGILGHFSFFKDTVCNPLNRFHGPLMGCDLQLKNTVWFNDSTWRFLSVPFCSILLTPVFGWEDQSSVRVRICPRMCTW